jgi:hypothetical protein
MASSEEKVPGGKLVNVAVSQERVTISGDFFIIPEEGVFQLEQALYSLNGDESMDTIKAMLSRLVRESDIKLIGLDEHVIARLYRGALDVAGHRP